MRFLLQVSAPESSELELLPGDSCRVGSDASLTDLCFADPDLSAVHCIVECDVTGVQVRDLRARTGTFVNGIRVTTQRLKDGDVITAGPVVLTVRASGAEESASGTDSTAESAGAAAESSVSLEESLSARKARLLKLLRAQPCPVLAILDAAASPRVLQLIAESGEESRSLLVGDRTSHLASVAPYLVAFPPDSKLLPKILDEGWGHAWGVFLTSNEDFMTVFYHVRQFLTITQESGKQLVFRFYDPRVLRTYLPTCLRDEADFFFGPISTFLIEDEDPGKALQFAMVPAPGMQTHLLDSGGA